MRRRIERTAAWVLAGAMGASAAWGQCGGRWLTSPEQAPVGLNSAVVALAVLPNGDLVAGGNFFITTGGVITTGIARWSGSSWAPLGSGMDEGVIALAVLGNGDLVAGGYFGLAGGVAARGIARWDGSSWSPLGTGMGGFAFPSVHALVEMPNGDVVAGGFFTTAGGVSANRIARWDGVSWTGLGSGTNNFFVTGLAAMPSGDVFACGDFTEAGGVSARGAARWDGSAWSALGSGLNNNTLTVKRMPNGDVVAGGFFNTAGGVSANCIAVWDGSSWAPLGSGMSGPSLPSVRALVVMPNGDLVAGGDFTEAGGVSASRIARWNGTVWAPLGSGISGGSAFPSVESLAVLPSGELIAGGFFTTAGGVASRNWARWTETGIPWVARQPTGRAVSIGQTVTLSATCASGYDFNGPVTFRWRRDGELIGNGPGGASPGGGTVSGASGALPSPTTDPTATLTIEDARASDAGQYSVEFINGCGSVVSAAAGVSVDPPACAPDLNGDGVVDFNDLLAFLNLFNAGDPRADFNGDGVIDFNDVLAFLNLYNAGC